MFYQKVWSEWKENPDEDYWVKGQWWKERYDACYKKPNGCKSGVTYKQQLTGCVTCPTKNWVQFTLNQSFKESKGLKLISNFFFFVCNFCTINNKQPLKVSNRKPVTSFKSVYIYFIFNFYGGFFLKKNLLKQRYQFFKI